ncbi:hypothetical protein [Saccharospirillum alexandrii]|uniref:hypothetical protein n=1 Tax=Saccharospirillum alexandrii TaxID=2448477 RepID=UPI000FDAEDD6|nr:hypothetical protein [Saccharospirillum alexandrii]
MKHLSMASAVTVLLVFTVVFLVSVIDSVGSDYSDFRISLVIAGVASLVACIVVIVWAIPVHFTLRQLKHQSLVWYLLAALIPGFTFIYAFKPFGQDSDIDLLQQALFCSFSGCIGAASFWYIAVYRQRITSHSSKDAPTRVA